MVNISHILFNSTIYRIEKKEVEKSKNWIDKEKNDYKKLESELSELSELKERYLTSSGLVCGSCLQRKYFKNCWDCYLRTLNRIKERERNYNSMGYADRIKNFIEIMNFNEVRTSYPELNKEQKKEIELNELIKILPQKIEEKEDEIEELKEKIEQKFIWQKQISEEKNFDFINSVDTNKKFIQHHSVEPRFFSYNIKDEWERILDKINEEIQNKYPRSVFIGENEEKAKQDFIYELEGGHQNRNFGLINHGNIGSIGSKSHGMIIKTQKEQLLESVIEIIR
ncbi:MAG: hypothetical protein GBAus27B_000063 [Mycoplasmataceae bacterium]|nr:MAG: hypothetical protein GBAus27B_000063 [Mycoplasmataceae bacterium]